MPKLGASCKSKSIGVFGQSNARDLFDTGFLQQEYNNIAYVALGGTALCDIPRGGIIDANWSENGTLRQDFVNELNRVLAICPEGFEKLIWLQGERDSANEDCANAYEQNLTDWFTIVQSIVPNTPIYIIEMAQLKGSYPYRNIVDQAHQNVANNMTDVYYIDTSGIGTPPDGVHWGSAQFQQILNLIP